MIIILILLVVLTIGLAINFSSEAELYLTMDSLNEQYHFRINTIVKFILMVTISLMTLDHDALFIKPLIAYFTRNKIATYKLVFYILVLLWFFAVVISLIISVGFIITPYYHFKMNYFLEYLKLLPDLLIMLLIILIIVRENRKPASFLILILLIVISFIQEDQNQYWLGYLLPISTSKLFDTTLGYIYLGVYVLLLIGVYYAIFNNENI